MKVNEAKVISGITEIMENKKKAKKSNDRFHINFVEDNQKLSIQDIDKLSSLLGFQELGKHAATQASMFARSKATRKHK
jgi:hypothetical protein